MNTGRVRRLNSFVTDLGYHQVKLGKVGFRIHRLIASAFLPNPMGYPIINHKDENPSNNCVDNLEWCTYKYNSNYGNVKVSRSKKVAQIDLDGTVVRIWDSIREATRNGYVRTSVSDCANGKIKFTENLNGCSSEYYLTSFNRSFPKKNIVGFRKYKRGESVSAITLLSFNSLIAL